MHPALEISLSHLLLAAVWFPPARRLMPELRPANVISLGYLLGATILLGFHHALHFAGVHSPALTWLGCAASWLLLTRPRRRGLPPMPAAGRRDCLGVAALTLFGLGLRLVDPLHHDSLAGGDSYLLLQYVHRFMEQDVVFHEYIAGVPVLFGSLRLLATPFDVLHFGPAVLASLGIPAFFTLGATLGGRSAAWCSAIGMCGVFGFLHIVSFNLVFVQFCSLCLALPWLILLTPMTLRSGNARHTALLVMVWFFLVLTGTYFALILSFATAAWVMGVRLAGAVSSGAMGRGLLVLSLVPVWIGFHYAVAAPLRNPQYGANFNNQVKEFEKIEPREAGDPAPGPAPPAEASSPAVRGLLLFAGPKRLELLRPSMAESAGLWILTAAAIFLLRKPFSAPGFTGAVILFSMVGTATGMFEMPGYQGRYLYLMILLGLPVFARVGIRHIAPALRRTRRFPIPIRGLIRRRFIASGALAACLPSVVFPPVAGENIPIARGLIVRQSPEDDILTRLAFSQAGKPPLRMNFLFHPGEDGYAGAVISELNRKEPVVNVDIQRVVCAGWPVPLPPVRPGQTVVMIMPRNMWDAAPPDERALIMPRNPDDVILMTARTVALRLDPDASTSLEQSGRGGT